MAAFFGVGDDRRDQVRDAVVGRQLDHLRVDQDHPELVGRGAQQQGRQQRVDAAGLTGTGRTGHEQVRHLREVGADEAALDVLAQPHEHRVRVLLGRLRTHDVAEADRLAVGVGHLDADGGLAGDRREDADVVVRDGVGQVPGQRGDLLDLDRRPELDLVAGHRRTAGEAGDRGVDVELLEDAGDRLDGDVVALRARLRRGSGPQHVERGQDVVPGDRLDGELLRLVDRRQVLRRVGPVDDRRAQRGVHRRGDDRRVDRGVRGAEVDRAGGEQVLRQGLPAEAATLRRRLLLVLVVLLVVVLVVLVVVAAQQPVGQLTEPLGDLVDRCRGDDEQAEERQEHEQDDGDAGADAGSQRRADGPADQAARAGQARLGVGRGADDLRDGRARRRPCRSSRSPGARAPPGGGRGGAAAARRRRGRRAAP